MGNDAEFEKLLSMMQEGRKAEFKRLLGECTKSPKGWDALKSFFTPEEYRQFLVSQGMGPKPRSLICVHGLKSETGRKCNGSVGEIINKQTNGRFACHLDGQKGKKSLQPANFDILECTPCGVGVGRKNLRTKNFNAICILGQETDRQYLSGDCCRFRGNLKMAISGLVHTSPLSKQVVLDFTDLNVARYCNKLQCNDDFPLLDESILANFCKIADDDALLRKSIARRKKAKGSIYGKFTPHRIRDAKEDLSAERMSAVTNGSYLIYPCPHPERDDSLEVRYMHLSADKTKKSVARQERFLDYGPEEALMYLRTAVAIGDTNRLEPTIFAAVDPQQFWSSILRFKTIRKELKRLIRLVEDKSALRLELEKVLKGWEKLRYGYGRMKHASKAEGFLYDEKMWDLSTKEKLQEFADQGSIFATFWVTQSYSEDQICGRTIIMEQQEEDKGVTMQSKVLEKQPEMRAKFRERQNAAGAYNESEDEEGQDAANTGRIIQLPMPVNICANCGTKESLKNTFFSCGRCESVKYCGKTCTLHWSII